MSKLPFRPYAQNQQTFFPQRIDVDIADDEPVRIINSIVDSLDLSNFNGLYKWGGRKAYHPKMMLKVILYAYMNNVYSCRKIENRLKRDIHFIWLAGGEKPDFITINRFRNRVKNEIGEVFTALVMRLAKHGLLSLDVEYIDGTKIESRANKYTFVWRKNVDNNTKKLKEKIQALLEQIDECMAQDNAAFTEGIEITSDLVSELAEEMKKDLDEHSTQSKEDRKALRQKKSMIKQLEKHGEKLGEYEKHAEAIGERNSCSKTDPDATFLHMKEDAMQNGQTKPGYNLQIGTNNQFITDFSMYPNPTDTLTLPSFLESFRQKYGHVPDEVVADSGYGSEENYRFMEENGIEAYVKYNNFHMEQKPRFKPNPFAAENLYYNEEEDYLVCPMGQHMKHVGNRKSKTKGGYVTELGLYRAERCEGCPLRCMCFKARGNREVLYNRRSIEYRRRAKELLTSQRGIEHRGKRCIEPEAVFGQMKFDMNYNRFRHVGKDKVTMDFTFFAIAFNLKKLCTKVKNKGGKLLLTFILRLSTLKMVVLRHFSAFKLQFCQMVVH